MGSSSLLRLGFDLYLVFSIKTYIGFPTEA